MSFMVCLYRSHFVAASASGVRINASEILLVASANTGSLIMSGCSFQYGAFLGGRLGCVRWRTVGEWSEILGSVGV